MTDETYRRVMTFVRRNAAPQAGITVPVIVDDGVPEDQPDLSEEPYAVGIRLCMADFVDLRRRVAREQAT